jgi:hypothetical protein
VDYWVRRSQGTSFPIDDLGMTIGATTDKNLADFFSIQIIASSADLAAALTASNLVRIDGFGGDPIGETSTSEVAGGHLAGTYPDPQVNALLESGAETSLAIGSINDGQVLKRVGTDIIGVAPGGGVDAAESETLTYTDTVNAVAGPLTATPVSTPATALWPIGGVVQDYQVDYTVREVIGGGAPGYYVCVSQTSTAPGGGSFSGGSNPTGPGIDDILVSGDKLRVVYPT